MLEVRVELEEEEKANKDLEVLSQPLVEAWHKIQSVTL